MLSNVGTTPCGVAGRTTQRVERVRQQPRRIGSEYRFQKPTARMHGRTSPFCSPSSPEPLAHGSVPFSSRSTAAASASSAVRLASRQVRPCLAPAGSSGCDRQWDSAGSRHGRPLAAGMLWRAATAAWGSIRTSNVKGEVGLVDKPVACGADHVCGRPVASIIGVLAWLRSESQLCHAKKANHFQSKCHLQLLRPLRPGR